MTEKIIAMLESGDLEMKNLGANLLCAEFEEKDYQLLENILKEHIRSPYLYHFIGVGVIEVYKINSSNIYIKDPTKLLKLCSLPKLKNS